MGLLNIDYDKLMTDPLVQTGLGILANNTGNYGQFAPAFGKGMMQGMQNSTSFKQAQQDALLKKQRMEQEQQSIQEYNRQQKAVDAFKTKFPQYGEAIDLDRSLALKAAYPNMSANSADPYTDVVYDANGNGFLQNHRETDPTKALIPINVNGKPFTGAKYSAPLTGALAKAGAGGKAAYEINTDTGTAMTGKQVAETLDPSLTQQTGMPTNNFGTPYPVTFGAPGTTATDRAEGVNGPNDVNVGNPARPRAFPSKLEQAVALKKAEADISNQQKADQMRTESQAQTQIDLPTITANAQNASRQIDELIGSRDGKIKPHAGFETAVGMSSKFDPRNYLAGTEATNFNTRLDQLKGGQFLQAFNSLKGGGAITEIEGKKATDAIARMNSAQTEDEFIKSARDYQDVIDSGLKRQQAKAGQQSIMPNNEKMPTKQGVSLPAKPSALTLKKGTIYATPKGNLTWNGKAFED